MKKLISVLIIAAFVILISCGCTTGEQEETEKKDIKRVGMVIKIEPEFIDEYKVLHADSKAGVQDLLAEAHMHNFSIFLHKFDDGNYY